MSQPIARADERASAAGNVGFSNARTARQLLAAAESFDNEAERQFGAIAMLRDAAVIAAQGVAQRRQVAGTEADIATTWTAVVELPALQLILQAMSSETRARLDGIVNGGFTAAYGDWSPAELLSLKQSLHTVVRHLVVELESDVLAPKRLRFHRMGRWLGAAVVLLLVGGYGVKRIQRLMMPRPTNKGSVNVALNKSVTMSSNWRTDIFPPNRLVDGDATQLGCHSSSQPTPWALIDLQAEYNIHRIVVTNRIEGLLEYAVPLRIELSQDGSDFKEYATQDEVFTVWTAKGEPTQARYVRVSVARTSILHLNEIEVY